MVNILKYGTKGEQIRSLLKKLSTSKGRGIDSSKYSGTIRLKEDPLEMQKKLRNEWK